MKKVSLEESVGTAVASGTQQASAWPEPINYRKRKKKRRFKYTKDTKDLQRLARGTTKASRRVAKAVSRGLREFDRQSDKSGRKRRDGAVKDGLVNAARGFAYFSGWAGPAPYEIAKRVPTRRLWKYVVRRR